MRLLLGLLVLTVALAGSVDEGPLPLDASHIEVKGERYRDGHDLLDPFEGPVPAREFHYVLPAGETRASRLAWCDDQDDPRRGVYVMFCFWETIDWARWAESHQDRAKSNLGDDVRDDS